MKTKVKIFTVAEWIGLSSKDFSKKIKWGTCIRCGKPAKSKSNSLCQGHSNAFHRWVNSQKREGK